VKCPLSKADISRAYAFDPLQTLGLALGSGAMSMRLTGLLIAAIAFSGAPSSAAGRPTADQNEPELALVSAACPKAESEEVETCAYKLVGESDRRIKANLCRGRAKNCEGIFAAFTRSRDGLIQSYLAGSEDSVVTRVEAALFALSVTRSFERRLHTER